MIVLYRLGNVDYLYLPWNMWNSSTKDINIQQCITKNGTGIFKSIQN